jgi:predicted HTH transcriptional regulator
LLIGVKDNGSISGITSEEEYFMIEKAATKYCIPEVYFTSKEWRITGKRILEINITKSNTPPHRTPDHNGVLKAYVRVNDQNKLANGIQMKIWHKINSDKDINFVYSEKAKELLKMFTDNDTLLLKQIISGIKLSRFKIENMLAELIIMKVIKMTITESVISFSLKDPLVDD